MTGRIRYLLAAAALFAAAAASAQPPQPPTLAELDKLAADALREVHNRGAELYNRGDPAGCYRMYEGAIIAIRPFLAHRPAALKALDDGLAEVSRSQDGVKVQAFRLHELIEQVRTDLKAGAKQPGPKPADPAATNPPAGITAGVKGTVKFNDGAPVDGVEVAFVSLDLPRPRVFTAKVQGGAYAFSDPLPAGKYAVIVAGKGVPEKYQSTLTSGIRVEVTAGPAAYDLQLTSK